MMTFQTDAPLEHCSLGATNRFAEFFVRNVQSGHMLLDPPYQRGDVWTIEQRMGLVRSWLQGIPIPAVIINNRRSPTWFAANPQDRANPVYAYAVIDGRQRIQTAINWFAGELLVPVSWFPVKHVETTEQTSDGPYVRYMGLTQVGQRFAQDCCVLPCAEGRVATVEQEAEIYMLVNGAGTPQTQADMDRAARVADGGPT